MRGFQPGEFTLDGESGLNMQLPPSGGMPPQTGGLMQQGGFLGHPFMTGPGNMPGNVPGMQPTGVPPTGVPPGGMGVGMPGNLGQMHLAPAQQTPLLPGNFGMQPGREPESRPGNMTMPNLGMMAPMWSGDQNIGNRGPGPDPGPGNRPNIPPMGQPMGNLGEGNQIGQQMAILAGGLPQSSGQVMGAFCAQLLGGSMPQGGPDLGAVRPPDKAPDPPGSMDALRQPWMLQELANAAMRDLDGSNAPQAPRLPEQMPQSSQNNPSLLTLQQQQQLILQQLQSSQSGHTAALAPSQLGFCGMSDLPGPGAPMGNQGPGPMPLQGPQAGTTMPQFPNQQLRMQGGMQNFPVNPDYQDVGQQLHDLEDKSRRLYPPGGATGNFYNPASGGDLGRRMEDDLNQGLLMDLRGPGGKGKAGKPDETLGQCGLGGKLGSVDRDEFRNLGGKGGKKGSKDSNRPGFGLTGSGPSGPSGPSGREKGKSKGSGEASFTTSGIGKMRYGNSPNKLFIGNLSLDVTSDDLIEALKPAGEVLGVRLRQGRYSSIAFAEFKHSGCVDVAVRTLQGLVIKGRPARMEFQSGKNERPEDEEPREKGGEKGKGGKGKGRGKGSKGKDAPSIRQPGPVPPGPMAGTLPPRLPVAPASPEA